MISRIKNRALRRAALIVSGPIIAVLGALCVGVGAGALEAMSFTIDHARAGLRALRTLQCEQAADRMALAVQQEERRQQVLPGGHHRLLRHA